MASHLLVASRSPNSSFPDLAIHLSPSLAGGVWLSGSFSSLLFSLACGVRPPGQFPPRFLHLFSSCLPLVSQMWSPNCLPIAFHNSMCLPELIFQLSPSVFHLSPRCFPAVFQMLFTTCHLIVSRLSCKCGLPVVSQLSLRLFQMCSPDSLPVVFHSTPTTPSCLPIFLAPQ